MTRHVRKGLTQRKDRRAIQQAQIEARLREAEAGGEIRVSWWRRLLRGLRAS
jgi:predicted transcriptional regulator